MISVASAIPSTVGSRCSSPVGEFCEANFAKLKVYLHNLAGYKDLDVDAVIKDHCYARPWNWKPENNYVKPIKKIFFPSPEESWDNDEIDVENVTTKEVSLPYDILKLQQNIDESEKLASFARPDGTSDDWYESVEKILWSPIQRRLFTRVYNILSAERLARLAKENSSIAPAFRQASIDISTKRFREILASTGYDWPIIQWLHSLLIDHFPQEYLVIYLDILQTLRAKIPQLVDRIIAMPPSAVARVSSISSESLAALLKRPWDPISSCLSANRPKKLPGNPILVIAPSGVGSSASSRQLRWAAQLGSLGTVVNVNLHAGLSTNRMTLMVCMDQLVQVTRAKIQDLRSDCPGRPIILVGFNTGAALACQVAQMEHVTAVVCLGFPFATVEGKRGCSDDVIMDIRCPIMFIIGQNASLVQPDDLEELRSKLLVESSLVVVGTADDYLRISTTKKIMDGITQNMADRCILDEIADYIGGILLQPHPLPLRPVVLSGLEKTKREPRKRKNSTSSSVDSESNFASAQKKSRPVTPIDPAATTNFQSCVTTAKPSPIVTQANLSTVTSSNATSGPKRKSKAANNPKAADLLIKSNINNANGSITVNIGSLASLAPLGPIRLGPTYTSASTIKTKTSTLTKTKMIHMQNPGGKLKTISPASKSLPKVTGNAFKGINTPESAGDSKLVTVFTSGGSIRVATPTTSAAMHSKPVASPSGTLTALLHSRRSAGGVTDGRGHFAAVSANSTHFESSGLTSSSISTTQVMESTTSQMTQVDSASTNSREVIAQEDLARYSAASTLAVHKTPTNPITIIPRSARDVQKIITPIVTTDMPIDEDLENILDLPIIFAKDDESLNGIEKLPSALDLERGIKSEAKVLLLGKDDKIVNRPKIIGAISDARPLTNHQVVLQAKTQNPSTSAVHWNDATLRNVTRPGTQTGIKYAKIILSKKSLTKTSGDQVILTRNTRKILPTELLSQNISQHKYNQFPVIITPKSSLETMAEGLSKGLASGNVDEGEKSCNNSLKIDVDSVKNTETQVILKSL